MDDLKIIAALCIIEDTMTQLGHRSHKLAGVTDAEVLLVGVVSAMYFQNHHENTLFVMKGMRYITKPLSISRFNRRLHSLAREGWLGYIVELVGELNAKEEVFIVDSVPVPVCHIVRGTRCRKAINNRDPSLNRLTRAYDHAGTHRYIGKCKAKKWVFYGWRLHLICTPAGVPVRFQMLPASFHDLTPIFELTFGLPKGAKIYADKGYISAAIKRALRPAVRRKADGGVYLVARHRKGMKRENTFEEWCGLKLYRHKIESANSQLERMGIQRLHARTDAGLSIKVLSSLFALACKNLF